MKNTVNKILIIAALAVALAGCTDVLNPPKGEAPAGTGTGTGTGTVILSVSGTGQRTILPLTPKFSKYEFTFIPLDGQQDHEQEDVGLEDKEFESIRVNLAEGNWTINVVGYTHISGIAGIPDGDYAVARGSENITVYEGYNEPHNIDIKAGVVAGETGVLSWDIIIPDDADSAEMRILNLDGTDETDPINLKWDKQGYRALAAGYYLVILSMNNEKPRAEVLHIYGYLTSHLKRFLDNSVFAFGSIGEMKNWLNNAAENSSDNPYNVMLYGIKTNDLYTMSDFLSDKYVNLDLSACEGTNMDNGVFGDSYYLIGITLPDSLTCIPGYAFQSCIRLTSVTIPNSVTSIGDNAFYNCNSLNSINIPDRVESIGNNAFSYCYDLTGVTIPDSVTSIGYGAFLNCISLTSINIPNKVTSIGGQTFWDCTSLTSVTIPNSVESIGDRAFQGCKDLTSVTIPNSVESIGDMAFYGCYGLTSITIPNNVTSIGYGAFNSCSSLESVSIGSGVTSIGSEAFGACTELTSVTVNSSNPNYSSVDGILYNKAKTEIIIVPKKITGNVTIPNSVISIDHYAFRYCTSLTDITIGNNVESIGNSAFAGCERLTNINIPGSVKSIGSGAFGYCTSLTSITIPDSVTSIEVETFYYSGLTSVTIPANITSIGYWAFCGTNLTSVTFAGTISEPDFSDFYSFPGDLRDKYLALGGGPGTYTTENPGDNAVWVKSN